MRIVSLIASSTEIVCALGHEADLVGRSHECDFPPAVQRLPALTAPKFPTDGTSYQIDERVKAILQEGLSVYRVDAEALRALQPDLIVTQTQCEVCAVSLGDVERALADWVGARPRVVSLAPDTLADVWRDIGRVAEALGEPARGAALVASLQGRVDQISGAAHARPERPRVACVEWIDPLMAAGNWMPELVELAAGVNLFGEAGRHSPWLSWEELVAARPDVVFVSPCGFDLARTRAEWPKDAHVGGARVVLSDGNQYFNRPGPRLVDSLEILAEVLHPGMNVRWPWRERSLTADWTIEETST